MSVQISYKKQALFGFILILCLLLVTEISMRVYDYYFPNCQFIESEVYDEISFELKREICFDNEKLVWDRNPLFLIPNQHFSTININSEGFRGNELQLSPDYRIFVIGGSTTFGVASTSDSTSIPAFLQQKISSDFQEYNIEVINAGIPKAYSFTEKNMIKEKLLNFNPDLLIVYDGWNDLEIEYENYEKSVDTNFNDQLIREIKRLDFATPNVLIKWYFNYKHDVNDVISFDSSKINEKASLWKNSWEEICMLEEKYDFQTAIILQPLLGTGNKLLTLEEQKLQFHYDSENRNQYYDLYANMLSDLKPACSLTLDLRDTFDDNLESIYFDSGHVGDNGNKIIAERIYKEILPLLENSNKL